MNFKEQSQLVTVLRDKFKEPISDDVIKELFDKKNEIAASDVGTSLEFDDFFVEVIVSWIGTDLTSQKANLLIELINSDNGAVDDSEDALLEELAVCEDLDGLKLMIPSETNFLIISNNIAGHGIYQPIAMRGGLVSFPLLICSTPSNKYCYYRNYVR